MSTTTEARQAKGGTPGQTPQGEPAHKGAAPHVPAHHRYLVLAGLVVAALLEVMDVTITNVALPQMAGNLGASTGEIAWVSTSYTLANAVLLPMTAWLAHRFGRKPYPLASIAACTLGSLLCGVSHSLPEISCAASCKAHPGPPSSPRRTPRLYRFSPPKTRR